MILNNIEDDYKLFSEDEVGYMTELHRRQTDYDAAFIDYMGPEFATEPLPSRDDLEARVIHLSGQLAGLHRLNAPKELTDGFQEDLAEVMTQIKSGKFSTTKSEIDYYEAYHKKASEFDYKGTE